MKKLFLLAIAILTVTSQVFAFSSEEILKLWEADQKSAALKQLSQWKRADKKTAGPWVLSAHIAFEQKKYKKCLNYAETALGKSPQTAEAYYWRGRAFEAMSKWMDAANEYRAALLVDPNYSQAMELLNRVNSQLGSASTQP